MLCKNTFLAIIQHHTSEAEGITFGEVVTLIQTAQKIHFQSKYKVFTTYCIYESGQLFVADNVRIH